MVYPGQVFAQSRVLIFVDNEDQLDVTRLAVRVVRPADRFRRSLVLQKQSAHSLAIITIKRMHFAFRWLSKWNSGNPMYR